MANKLLYTKNDGCEIKTRSSKNETVDKVIFQLDPTFKTIELLHTYKCSMGDSTLAMASAAGIALI